MTMWLETSTTQRCPIQVNLDQIIWIDAQPIGDLAVLHHATGKLQVEMSVAAIQKFIRTRQAVENPVKIDPS
jgi:hypothetical protein